MKRSTIISLIILVLLAVPIYSQDDLDETLSNLSTDAAKSYVYPAVNGFGANLNSGWFDYAPAPVTFKPTVRLRLIANGTFFGDEDKTFSTEGMYHFNSDQAEELLSESGISSSDERYQDLKDQLLDKDWSVSIYGPTIVGSEDDNVNVYFEGTTLTVDGVEYEVDPYEIAVEDAKGYLDGLSLLPTPNIQLTLGTVAGTNIAFRWFPSIDIQDLGKFKFFGFGVIHNTNYWFKSNPLPVDLSVGIFYQSLEVGDIFESSAFKYGVYASKTFGYGIAFTPYIGLTMESSTTTVNYTYYYDTPAGEQEAEISFDMDGDNNAAFTIGFSAKLYYANLNVDYKAANSGTLTAGFAFGLL